MNPYPNPSREAIDTHTQQAQDNARAEIARNVERLLAFGNVDAPESKLALWEHVGAAVMEYLHADEALVSDLRRRILVLEACLAKPAEAPTTGAPRGGR